MLRPMLGEAWHAMGANRLRTALTMLGMVIGVGSVVLMMAIGQGAQYAVAQTISTMGSNLYVIISGWTQQSGVRTGSGFGYTLKIGDADAIGELDDITQVAPVFGQKPFFLSDEFSLVDCYLAPLLWRLPILGVEFSGPGAKELKGYMTRVFERDSFLASLTEPEREMRLGRG